MHPFLLAQSWRQEMENDTKLNKARIAAREGVSRARVTQIMNLLQLPAEIQADLLKPPAPFEIHSFQPTWPTNARETPTRLSLSWLGAITPHPRQRRARKSLVRTRQLPNCHAQEFCAFQQRTQTRSGNCFALLKDRAQGFHCSD